MGVGTNDRRGMSIKHRRPAAGQWTAAHVREDALQNGARRGKRIASWLLIVPTLAFFSLSLVAGARALSKPDYAKAAKQLSRGNRRLVVVAAADKTIDNFLGWFTGRTGKEVCSVTQSQLT